MTRIRRRKIRSPLTRVTFHRFLPNMATIGSLCAGMSAVRFALMERWETAVALIFIAAVLDGMDGRLARMLGSVSRFGAHLDSLSDFMSFGVAPAFILYHFSLNALGGLGWGCCLVFTVCMSLRLARFNVQAETPSPLAPLKSVFFTGVPAPAAAVMGMLPLIIWLDQKCTCMTNPWIVGGFTLITAALMISRLPTFAFKTLKVSQNMMIPLLLGGALGIAGLISAPWRTLLILVGIYIFLFPFSYWKYRMMSRNLLMHSHGESLS